MVVRLLQDIEIAVEEGQKVEQSFQVRRELDVKERKEGTQPFG